MKTATKTTHVIAGHAITLQPGCRYRANRPIAERGRTSYPVWIYETVGSDLSADGPAWMSNGLTYDQANELLAAFNNEETSFTGRVWE